MSARDQPLTRRQRLGLRMVFVGAVLLMVTAVVAMVVVDAEATTADYVLRLSQVVCGGVAGGASAWRLRRDAKR